MAKAGDVLQNPITGQSLTFRQTTADTGEKLLEVESSWESGGQEPPEHYHPHQEEHFEVLEGGLRARVGHADRTLRAGEEMPDPDKAAAMFSEYVAEFRLGRPGAE